jgi:hypothetical protein
MYVLLSCRNRESYIRIRYVVDRSTRGNSSRLSQSPLPYYASAILLPNQRDRKIIRSLKPAFSGYNCIKEVEARILAMSPFRREVMHSKRAESQRIEKQCAVPRWTLAYHANNAAPHSLGLTVAFGGVL